MTMGRKRKVSFLRRILEKINPSLPYEPEDPGEEVSDVEDTSSLVTRDTETPNSHGVTDLIRAAQNIIVLDENGEQVFIQDPALLNNLETASVYTTAGSTITTATGNRKSTRLNSSHITISYAVFCLKKKKTKT